MQWAYNSSGPGAYRPPLCREIEAALGGVIGDAQQARPPERAPPPRWTLRRLMHWVEQRFGRRFCRETIRAALQRLKLSWKKAKKLLGRPNAKLSWTISNRCSMVPRATGTCWSISTRRTSTRMPATAGRRAAWVCSTSPGLSAKRTFYGLYLYNDGQVRLWPYPRGNGEHTIDVLGRLRAEFPERPLIVLASATTALKACARRQPNCRSSCRATAPTSCRSRRCGAGCAKTSPTSTATPAWIDWKPALPTSRTRSTKTPSLWLIALR
jgi:hypothetical protein